MRDAFNTARCTCTAIDPDEARERQQERREEWRREGEGK